MRCDRCNSLCGFGSVFAHILHPYWYNPSDPETIIKRDYCSTVCAVRELEEWDYYKMKESIKKQKRGFAIMGNEQKRSIASKGGKATAKSGKRGKDGRWVTRNSRGK